MCNQTELRYVDGRKLDRKFTSPLHKMRALQVHVPHPKKPGTTVLEPVVGGAYINTDDQYRGTVTVMIVSDRR